MATENVQDAATAAAEKLAEAAAAAGGEASAQEDATEELLGGESDQWTFFTKALVAVVVIIVCFVANKAIRGESPEEKRQRLRNQRRAKKKAEASGPDVSRNAVGVRVGLVTQQGKRREVYGMPLQEQPPDEM
ncbi:unnamed protein product [Scytosiphon promiscuus]